MNERIKIGKLQWHIDYCGENKVKNKSLENEFFSWGSYSIPTKYIKCSLRNLGIRKSTFKSLQFIECDFSNIDASDSLFINCLFQNCNFRNANFHKTSFIGSLILQKDNYRNDNNFEGAGMAQTSFMASQENKCIFANLKLNALGFRNSIFKNVYFSNINIEHSSFEEAYFEKCNIDFFDSRFSSCRGIVFKNCFIKTYISTIEKTISSIGALEMLNSCKNIELHLGNFVIKDIQQSLKILKDGAEKFANEGKLFEFINIMHFLYNTAQFLCIQDIKESKMQLVTLSKNKKLDGYRVSDMGSFLYYCILKANEILNKGGKSVDLENILYLLKMIYFFDINEYLLLRVIQDLLTSIKKTKPIEYSDFLSTSQIEYYLNEIGKKTIRDVYRVELRNEGISWQKFKDVEGFYEFGNTLIKCSDISNYRLISMHQGSIETIFEIVDPIKLIMVVTVLGVDFNYTSKDGFSFTFNPAKGIKIFGDFMKKITSIIIPFQEKKNINEGVFNKISNAILKSPNLKKYINKNKISGTVEQQNASLKSRQHEKKIKKRVIELDNKDN